MPFGLFGGLGGGLGSFPFVYGILFIINLIRMLISGEFSSLTPPETMPM